MSAYFGRLDLRDLIDHSDMPPTERSVLRCIGEFGAKKSGRLGKAWPSVDRVARYTGLSEAAVRRAVRRLQLAGWLEDTGEREGRTNQVVVFVIREKGAATSWVKRSCCKSFAFEKHTKACHEASQGDSLKACHGDSHSLSQGQAKACQGDTPKPVTVTDRRRQSKTPGEDTKEDAPPSPATQGGLLGAMRDIGVDPAGYHPLTSGAWRRLRRELRRCDLDPPYREARAACAAAVVEAHQARVRQDYDDGPWADTMTWEQWRDGDAERHPDMWPGILRVVGGQG